jgi:hypothetical protein
MLRGWAGAFVALAPDDLHKDNTRGGDPYGLHLSTTSADFGFLSLTESICTIWHTL